MNASKVSFTEEFLKLGERPTTKDIAHLRYKKLQEADENGELQSCKTRWDVAALLGLAGASGYAYVANIVNKGTLREHLTPVLGEYEYHVGHAPYQNHLASKAKKSKKNKKMAGKLINSPKPSANAELTTKPIGTTNATKNNYTGMTITITDKYKTVKIEAVPTALAMAVLGSLKWEA